jgi:Na+-driven multidrug efflux pump
MRLCNKNLNPFQRRSMQLIGAMMAICGGFTSIFSKIERSHFSTATYCLIAALAVTPIIGTMIVIARYLDGEKDEYLRHIVTQSILWGFGLVMVVDTFLGYVIEYQSPHIPVLTALNLEIFLIVSAIALRIQMWRNQ